MDYFECENKECAAVYFADAHDGFSCNCCGAHVYKMTDDQAIKYFNEVTAWPEHPTVSC